MEKAYYLKNDQFIIEQYDRQKPFASFLPGVAGLDGIPMWVYYTNRGQGIAGFGVENKDGAILDFVPANQSYRRTELAGFRTLVKKEGKVYEIFSSSAGKGIKRQMIIEANALGLVEENQELDLKVAVKYFTTTGEKFPALIRKVSISSLSGQCSKIELLDGLMTLWPYGTTNDSIKNMSNLAMAWFETYRTGNNLLFYRNRSTAEDSAQVGIIEAGHFYGAYLNGNPEPLPVFDNPQVIFGMNTANTKPWNFAEKSLQELLKTEQVSVNKIPCAFCAFAGTIKEERVITSIIGKINRLDLLTATAERFNGQYFREQEQKAEQLGLALTKDVEGKTAYPVFDAYIKQSFLDNLLRGGYPVLFKGKEGPIVYHVYSRIHGDMEREYNNFYVEPTYYSHGVGAFRDVNQNRRNDVYFVPEAGRYNIKQFMELIQLDGQNPLTIQGSRFKVTTDDLAQLLAFVEKGAEQIKAVLSGEFTPGQLLTTIDHDNIKLTVEREAFLKQVLESSTQETKANFGHGYWVDHWTYNMDLIDNYLNIYPDHFADLLFNQPYRYFLSPAVVLPRVDKYVKTKDGRIRQYDAVYLDQERIEHLGIALDGSNWEKKKDGTILTSNLFAKLFCLVLNKVTSMDPSGLGIMMNTDKPGWNDAMNGLPGLFGSGTSETVELQRIVKLLLRAMKYNQGLVLPKELGDMAGLYIDALTQYLQGAIDDLKLYEEAQLIKEQYNAQIALGVAAIPYQICSDELKEMLRLLNTRLEKAINKAIKLGNGIMPSYLIHDAVGVKEIKGKRHPLNGLQNVEVYKWKLRPLPLYLEAPARYLQQLSDRERAKALYDKIRQSGLYDDKLGMYITSESLDKESLEIGRARAFVPGWLERESCFMHMEYKYLLGLLKTGLYDQFFQDIKTAFPPFMDPAVYGRSILENSSFIASTRNPDRSEHGRGFVARLTGTTAELITMWLFMMTGMKLFTVKGGELCFTLNPLLPSDFFDEKNEVRFTLFSDTTVIYRNPLRKATYGDEAAIIISYTLTYQNGPSESVEVVSGRLAEDLRQGLIDKIVVQLG